MRIDSSEPSAQNPLAKLVYELSKLPGIGEKTATRLSYFILRQDSKDSRALADAILFAKEKIGLCEKCFNFTNTQKNPCSLCSNPARDQSTICVVEKPSDVHTIEKTAGYNGLYHVLHGVLSPIDGIGPENLKIRELLLKLSNSEVPVQEIFLAINPSVEGDATALYIAKLTRHLVPKVTKLAHGLPVGGVLEYTDRHTLVKAVENRSEV